MKEITLDLLNSGCWNNPDEQRACDTVSPDAACVGHPIVNNSTFFCCCRGNLCNANLTEGTFVLSSDFLDTKDVSADYISSDYRTQTITIALSSVSALAVIIVIVFLVYRLRCVPRDAPNDPFFLGEPLSTPLFIMEDLHTTHLIASGRFGTVWKGQLSSVPVAIKVFSPAQRQYFTNEQDILNLPHMTHVALPKFYGAGERESVDGIPEYLIVMEYIESGSLTEYLRTHTLDWIKLCRMMYSAAAGLAHLHADFTKADKSKPAIAHRDFNSRNIMVKADLSCCLVDFGFATRIDGCHFYRNGQEENAEQTSLSDVGTVRYMSPEVLEGAVNLRDCEASLKQIDVYALGLVIWEMAMRCTDLFQGLTTPEYQLPFQAELGLHPSFEQMQVWVSRNKQRPPFPDIWKDTNQAIRALKETIEDCWDQDAEARLTAMCVEERALDMTTLWENRHKGTPATHR
ncbi:hypothetical protein CAPTEDRAFT_117843 [Capitella teleta]|uniref:Serine/threonine-protein kinase receptor n=1 Tax=Capitella teleta TaxID=283909 RepID=R7U8P4_CAPTE|nr:hypothetical protein CAPTEDRAFT_117843 [Capitella teleta]|eukprot:ELU02740.1 hypothetical protein CAPTEDRAFT_117843 [Capitella teleta]